MLTEDGEIFLQGSEPFLGDKLLLQGREPIPWEVDCASRPVKPYHHRCFHTGSESNLVSRVIVKDCAASVIKVEVARGATSTADHYTGIAALRSALWTIRRILVGKT